MHLSEPGCRNNPVEVLETKLPMFIEHYGYRPGTGGPGLFRDMRNGFVSPEAAARDCGVAVNPRTFTVDQHATRRLRAGAG